MHNAGSHPNNTPFWLLAELTYACPLQCPYCSNPNNFNHYREQELTTQEWASVLQQARELGAVQLGLSGGEPCTRKDLVSIVATANELGFYTNLLTSTAGLNDTKLRELIEAGLNHIQVSFQGKDAASSQPFAGIDCFQHKLTMAKRIRELGIPMVLNFVLHRHNICHIEDYLNLAIQLDAEAVELANCQYQGWATKNISALLPSQQQLLKAEQTVIQFRQQNPTAMPIMFVVPDLYEGRPRPCVNGWGTTLISVSPNGDILPCQGAASLPNITLPNIRNRSLHDIWHKSTLFNQYRGLEWLPEPCQSCEEKEKDFGGCRCQAFALTGNPAATDPACDNSPHHQQVIRLRESVTQNKTHQLVMRSAKNRIHTLSS